MSEPGYVKNTAIAYARNAGNFNANETVNAQKPLAAVR